jgi:Xaa-Pro dipeptidase
MLKLWFSEIEYLNRLAAARSAIVQKELDALIVSGPENICYLTGFSTPGYHIFQCVIVQPTGKLHFVVRNIEAVNVPDVGWIGGNFPIEVPQLQDASTVLVGALTELKLDRSRIGFEERAFYFQPQYYRDLLSRLPNATFVPGGGIVESARSIKSPAEVDLIERAVGVAEDAIRVGATATQIAATDSDVAAEVLATLARLGSEYTGSPAYVVAGLATLQTHSNHARRPIAEGDLVRMEVSASLGRYHGVATRYGVKGTPSREAKRLFDISSAATAAMIAAGRPGLPIGDMDKAGRTEVHKYVPASFWPNRGGYSMGLSFPPGLGEGDVLDIKPGDQRPLEEGMVFHLLPILRSPEVGAIGCTETVVITNNGCRTLSTLPRTLPLVDPS